MKRALITGSTKGIGLAIAEKLIQKGYFVYMNYAHDDEAAASIGLSGERHRLIKADVSTAAGADALAGAILQDACGLDCLILNAGATCRAPFGEISGEDWAQVMNANVNMPFFIVQKLRNLIRESGCVVFIGSDMGIYPHAVSIPYSVSKAAVHMLARSLVKEFAGRNIRVNALAPGFIDSDWQKEKPQWLREKIEGKIALRRFGLPEEVAEACMALIDGKYINGAVLRVDGGYDME